MIKSYIERIDNALQKSLKGETKLTNQIFEISGMSSREGKIFLNEILKDGDKYLEIGVYRGSTFVSALYNNNVTAVAIDNFTEFDGNQINKIWFDQSCRENNITNYNFINNDCFNLTEVDKQLIKHTNVYFYDGGHTEADQEKALTYFINYMTDKFIFIVDDWNFLPAKIGTQKGLEKTNLKVHKEWHLTTEHTGKPWHNGMYVAVLEKI